MSAAAALNVVKQIQAVADGPPTSEMRACLGQVVSSLLLFLDHPDSRVRLGSARTLLKLSEGYREDVHKLDMTRATACLKRCKDAVAMGSADADGEELCGLLKELLSQEATPAPATPQHRPTTYDGDGGTRGEVVLKVGGGADDSKVKAAILEKVVTLPGVVSITFEGAFVIVSTRSAETAADASFLADLLVMFREQGIQGVSLVNTGAPSPMKSPGGNLLPPAEGGSAAAGSTAAGSTAPGPSASSGAEQHTLSDDEDDGEEPAYLDDEEEEEGAGSPMGGGMGKGPPGGPGGAAHWSFFAQSNWMTGRRMQEFGDDPTIAARLAKAKVRAEEKRQEEKSRIGRLTGWLTGSK